MLLYIILDKAGGIWYTRLEGLIMTLDQSEGTPETSIAGALIPYSRDDDKARYLGYKACGFSVREALQMIEKSKSTLSIWRRDQVFVDLENRIPDIRKELSKEYISIEFYRNFRLVLEKDYKVLRRSLRLEQDSAGNPVAMTQADQSYLLRMRSNYTPQQLSILEVIVASGAGGFDFARFIAENPDIVQMQRTDTITMAKARDGA